MKIKILTIIKIIIFVVIILAIACVYMYYLGIINKISNFFTIGGLEQALTCKNSNKTQGGSCIMGEYCCAPGLYCDSLSKCSTQKAVGDSCLPGTLENGGCQYKCSNLGFCTSEDGSLPENTICTLGGTKCGSGLSCKGASDGFMRCLPPNTNCTCSGHHPSGGICTCTSSTCDYTNCIHNSPPVSTGWWHIAGGCSYHCSK